MNKNESLRHKIRNIFQRKSFYVRFFPYLLICDKKTLVKCGVYLIIELCKAIFFGSIYSCHHGMILLNFI